jgi:lipopolysaccharide transport system permease protein
MHRYTTSMNPMGLLRHRELIAQLTRREVSQRYKGSLLGMAWPLVQPLLMLTVYTFVFSVVFRARWPSLPGADTADFALVIFTGLITFSIFSETVSAAPGLILANRNLVKRSVFPLEILPIVKASGALVQGVFSLMILLAGMLALGFTPSWTALCLPAVWLPLWLFSIGSAYFLSALGVFVRDLGQLVGVVITALFFGSAIFLSLSAVSGSGVGASIARMGADSGFRRGCEAGSALRSGSSTPCQRAYST